MSRIGKASINIPSGVLICVKDNVVEIKGSKGELYQKLTDEITLEVEGDIIKINRPSDSKKHAALHGLYRSLISNMIKGVSEGFIIKLELVGVGYRVFTQGKRLEMSLGFSHGILFQLPKEVLAETISEKGKNPIIILKSSDKQLLGMVAAKIRSFRKPEPYKGKGIKFVGEIIRRKAGKSVK